MDITKFTQSKSFTVTIIVIAAVLGLLLAFGLGVSVGFHKAKFSYQWGENYDRNFGGPKRGIIGMFGGSNFMNAHGIAGSIIKIDGSTIIIKDGDSDERTVLINGRTVMREGSQSVKISDLHVDDNVIIIGNPDDSGQIQAELMRILPSIPPLPLASPPVY